MKHLRPMLFLVLAFVVATPVCSMAAKKFESPYVDLVMGSAMMPPGQRPSIVIGLANKGDRPLWARVRMQSAAGVTACDSTRRIGPKAQAMFACAQDTLIAGTDYPFTVSVYADSTLTGAADENSTSIHFDRAGLKQLTELSSALQLPMTYENVIHSEKLGLGAMMGVGGNGSRLIVNPDGIEYQGNKGTIKIAAAQMRGVRLVAGGSFGAWVVVDYQVSGGKKMLALRPSTTKGSSSVNLMRASLDNLFSTTKRE